MNWGEKSFALDEGNKRGGQGLYLHCTDGVSAWRHFTVDRRCAGLWEVFASPRGAIAEVMGHDGRSRPAVVDDFGSLVFVGGPQ